MIETRTIKVDLAANGTVVAAVPGKSIRVLGFFVSALLATNVKFQSAATTDISAQMSMGNTGGFVVPFTEYGWFQTAQGEALTLNMSVNTTVGVQVIYALA